jgi:phage portal protein BeeE
MDIIQKFFSALGWGNSNYYTTQQIGSVAPQWVNTSNKWNLYNTIPELNAVINRYADMVASANPIVKDKKGNVVESNANNIFRLIDRPNAMQTWGKMMKMIAINQCVTNNVLVYAPNGSFGKLQLLPLAFNNVKIVPTGKNLISVDLGSFIEKFQIPTSRIDDYKDFMPDEVIYISEIDGINLFDSKSKIDALKMPLSNLEKQYVKRNVLLVNMFSLGILSGNNSDGISAMPIESEDIEKIRKDMKKRNEGEVIISDKPLKFDPMTFPVKDLMLFEEMNADKLAIIDAYGLNQHMFGQGEGGKGSTFSNVEMGERQAYNSTIIPATEILYDEITKQIGLDKDGLYLVPDFTHISVLKSDETKSAESLLKRATAVEKITTILPTISEEEKRKLLGI